MIFDHIGVVVPSLAEGRSRLAAVPGVGRWTAEFPESANGVAVQFGLDASGVCYELVAPLGETSPVAAALATGGRILNHVAYRVADLAAAAAALRAARCVPTGPARPAIAYGGRPIQFFLSPARFIVELIEAPDHAHAFAPEDAR